MTTPSRAGGARAGAGPQEAPGQPRRGSSRVDLELVRRNLARSRGEARRLLAEGVVRVDGRTVTRPSDPVRIVSDLAVGESERWVSRAAYKLVGALEEFALRGLSVAGRSCLDVGASTGGFTQVLLAHGASHVVAVDVGHGQLAAALREDPRVDCREGVNVRDLTAGQIGGRVGVVVADLSFISLRLVLDMLHGLVVPGGDVVLLVKPQFEVGRAAVGRSGVVRTPAARRAAVAGVLVAAVEVGLLPVGACASRVAGTGGNVEYLVWCRPGAAGAGEVPPLLERVLSEAGLPASGRPS